jgi:3D (Asp-Asp-Asp) domain-containing protein
MREKVIDYSQNSSWFVKVTDLEERMSLHVSGKLLAIGLVCAALITAFRLPTKPIDLHILPTLMVAQKVNVRVVPRIDILEPIAITQPQGASATPSYVLKATGYNSHASQTDSTPNITATGATTAFGIIAASRDLLGDKIPYGSLVRIRDLGNYRTGRGVGHYQELLGDTLFIVEDTMHPRKVEQVDIWFPHLSQALNWGVRRVEVEVVRYGREDNDSELVFATAP